MSLAYDNLETLELYARTLIYAGLIGKPRRIPPAMTEILRKTFTL